MILLEYVNLAIRFLVEMLTVFIIAYWGFTFKQGFMVKISLGVILPIAIVAFWGLYAAPKAPYKVNDTIKLILEIGFIIVACSSLHFTKYSKFTILFAIVSFLNLFLMYLLKRG